MCTICESLRPHDDGCAYAQLAGSGSATLSGAGPTYSLNQVASFLNTGYWNGAQRHFDVSAGGQITYNISALTATGQTHARNAFDAWSDATGINFVETTGGAKIAFDDENSGAYASYSYSRGYITNAFVNVDKGWDSGRSTIDSYHYQTYLHEIGHALGLGHGGKYNGSANYGVDNRYANDSWQMSVMSYFSQAENTAVDASFAYTITPMLADVLAVRQLYGAPGTRLGDTVYGEGGNTGTYLDAWLSLANPVALTLYDSGGHDLIDLSSQGHSQRIDLNPAGISDVQGLTGNLLIARGTMIEAVATGSGDDSVTGNRAANTISLGAGDDRATGGRGNDLLQGGSGADVLFGGRDADTLHGGSDDDLLYGGGGRDTLHGDGGGDRLDGQGGNDALYGGSGADVLLGGSGADFLSGEDDADWLNGARGRDRLYGDAGDDTAYGGGGADFLYGGTGNDMLYGGGGRDQLFGDDGSDLLDGGRGRDRLEGGLDSDVFRFTNRCGRDVVTDFDALDALERIDLSAYGRITDWTDLSANHLKEVQSGCMILGGRGDKIVLLGVDLDDLDASDFIF